MFPLKDENPTGLWPAVTVAIIGLNAGVWLTLQEAGAGEGFLRSLCRYGFVPGELTGAFEAGEVIERGPLRCELEGRAWPDLFSSMFMHGSWVHLIGNMWFLWVFGNNIEDSMGHARFIVFYLLAGLVASGAHLFSAPESGVPTVGASGAISGVMGAYLLLYPSVKVHTLIIVFVFIRVWPLPAWLILGEWFLLQLIFGTTGAGGGGVAFWAHIGGFVAGLLLTPIFRRHARVRGRSE